MFEWWSKPLHFTTVFWFAGFDFMLINDYQNGFCSKTHGSWQYDIIYGILNISDQTCYALALKTVQYLSFIYSIILTLSIFDFIYLLLMWNSECVPFENGGTFPCWQLPCDLICPDIQMMNTKSIFGYTTQSDTSNARQEILSMIWHCILMSKKGTYCAIDDDIQIVGSCLFISHSLTRFHSSLVFLSFHQRFVDLLR